MEYFWDSIITQSVVECDKPNLVHQGGTYSGKSVGVIMGLILLLGEAKKKLEITVTAMNMPHLTRGVLGDFKAVMHDANLWNNKYWNGSEHCYRIGQGKIEFIPAIDIARAKTGKRDILFINEANDIDYLVARELMDRARTRTIIDFNPDAEFWAHEHMIGKPETDYFVTTYKDNPYTPQKIIDGLEAYRRSDPERYRVYALGLTAGRTGIVFPKVRMVEEFPKMCKWIAYGVDYGFTNDPSTVVRVGFVNGEIWIEELYYETGVDDMGAVFEMCGIRKRIDEIWPDPSQQVGNIELRKKGWNIQDHKHKDIMFGINIMQRYWINIVAPSKNAKREFKSYRFKTDKDGKITNELIKGRDQTIDPVRYCCSNKLYLPQIRQRYGSRVAM